MLARLASARRRSTPSAARWVLEIGSPVNQVAPVTLAGGPSFPVGTTIFGNGPSGSIAIGGAVTAAGAPIAFTGPVMLLANATIDTTKAGSFPNGGGVTFTASLDGSAASAQSLGITSGAGAVTFSGNVGATTRLDAVTLTAGAIAFDGTVASASMAATSSGAITVGAILTASGSVSLVASGNLTLAGAVTGSGSGDAVVLATGGVFDNAAGSAGVVANGGGRWLIWSQNPANDTVGGLAFAFKQYDAFYVPPLMVQGSGNGLLYTIAPQVTVSLVGSVTKTYDGSTNATLTPANYALTGALSGDTVVPSTPTSGSYASANAGPGLHR